MKSGSTISLIRRIETERHTSTFLKSSIYQLDQCKVAVLFWVPHVSLCILRTSVKKKEEKNVVQERKTKQTELSDENIRTLDLFPVSLKHVLS